LSYLSILLLEGLSFLIYLCELFFDLDHDLIVSDYHKISKEDELVVIDEDISNVFS
jgi:hypothetical protein